MYKLNQFSPAQMDHFKSVLANTGYLFIEDLSDDFDHFSFVQEFGTLVPQYDGRVIWTIKADPKFDAHYHSLNTKKLSPHTECYEFEGLSPKYLSLWCKIPASCGGGQTTLYDFYKFVDKLDKNDVNLLREMKLTFVSSSGIQESALGRSAKHSILSNLDGGEKIIVRFSKNCIQGETDPRISSLCERFVQEFEENHVAISWKRNSFLIWDNHRVVHSRTSYEDRDRALERVWLA